MKTQCGKVTGNLLLLSKYKHNNAGPVPNAIKVLTISNPQVIRKNLIGLGPTAELSNMRVSNLSFTGCKETSPQWLPCSCTLIFKAFRGKKKRLTNELVRR